MSKVSAKSRASPAGAVSPHPLHPGSLDEAGRGACSPDTRVPSFMNMPHPQARLRIKKALAILATCIVVSSYFWPNWLWQCVYAGVALLLLGLAWWWVSVEVEVWRSQRVNLYAGAPVPGQERPRRSSLELQSSHISKYEKEVALGPKRVCILRGNAGGGHIAALEAIKDVIRSSGLNWELIEVDLPQLIETHEQNVLHSHFNVTGEELYNWCLANGSFLSSFVARTLSTLSRFFLFVCHTFWPVGTILARDIWKREKPDMVISVITMLNRVACDGLRAADMGHIPYVTIVTDLAHSFVHPWLQCPDQYVVAGTETIYKQAVKLKYPSEKIFRVSGMVMRPSFYFEDPRSRDRAHELREMGLDPARRTCLVFYGGYAPSKMPFLAREILKGWKDLNLIFICGKNEELKHKLDYENFGVPTRVVGYTRNVPLYMSLSDFCVCKPGPAVVSEAAWFGLPLLLEHNMATLAQEKVVVDFAVENRLALLWRRQSQLPDLAKKLKLSMGDVPADTFRRIGHTIAPNHAIFEVPDILVKILRSAQRR